MFQLFSLIKVVDEFTGITRLNPDCSLIPQILKNEHFQKESKVNKDITKHITKQPSCKGNRALQHSAKLFVQSLEFFYIH